MDGFLYSLQDRCKACQIMKADLRLLYIYAGFQAVEPVVPSDKLGGVRIVCMKGVDEQSTERQFYFQICQVGLLSVCQKSELHLF